MREAALCHAESPLTGSQLLAFELHFFSKLE